MCLKNVKYEDIYTEGITKITAADFLYAKEMDMTVKLLAMSKNVGNEYFAMVAPFLISKEHPLYSVNDVFNAVFVHGNMLGDSMYYGRGAGKLPTASAVVSDVIDCARHIGKTVMCLWEDEDVKLADIGQVSRRFFVRVDQSKADEEKAKEIFGQAVIVRIDALSGEFGLITEPMTEKAFGEKAEQLGAVIGRIRIED